MTAPKPFGRAMPGSMLTLHGLGPFTLGFLGVFPHWPKHSLGLRDLSFQQMPAHPQQGLLCSSIQSSKIQQCHSVLKGYWNHGRNTMRQHQRPAYYGLCAEVVVSLLHQKDPITGEGIGMTPLNV